MRRPGNTPLIEIEGVLAKLECTNPCGSIKDRIAVHIIEESERSGALAPGMRIVEATSGNTGIAFAWFARKKGYPVTIVMPENMSQERKDILRSLGVDLVLCSKQGSFAEAASIRDRLAEENGWFNPDQFSNPLNVDCHYATTGEEILQQMQDRGLEKVDAFVAGIGTGGTIIGVGKRLREANPDVHIVAVEPSESAVMSGGAPGAHDIQGIGDGFIPAIASDGHGGVAGMIDEVIAIPSEDAKRAAEFLREKHGCCVGVSSGANYLAARQLKDRFNTVATVFPDGYRKYQSMGLRHCAPGSCPFEHDPVV